MSLVLQSSGGGSVTLQEAVTASNLTITVPAVTGTMAINGPAFSAVPSGAQTGIANSTDTKILFQTETFDTNSNFDSSRFTPTVAGYYQINSCVSVLNGSNATNTGFINIYKNGSFYRRGTRISSTAGTTWYLTISDVVYCNGSTDYLEIFAFSNGGIWQTEGTFSFFSGALVRGA